MAAWHLEVQDEDGNVIASPVAVEVASISAIDVVRDGVDFTLTINGDSLVRGQMEEVGQSLTLCRWPLDRVHDGDPVTRKV